MAFLFRQNVQLVYQVKQCGSSFYVNYALFLYWQQQGFTQCTVNNERLVYGWRKILENIMCGYGHHEWPAKATSNKSNIFTSDDHNHK